MGKRGPPPKPSALKKLEGTYRKDRAARNEVTPPPGAPRCPPHLDPIARVLWDELVPQLQELGILARVDAQSLEGLCVNYAMATKYQKLADKAPMVKTPWGPKPNPAATEARKAWSLVRQFAAEFGLSPSARTRVSVPEQKQETATEDFLFGGRPLQLVKGGGGGG